MAIEPKLKKLNWVKITNSMGTLLKHYLFPSLNSKQSIKSVITELIRDIDPYVVLDFAKLNDIAWIYANLVNWDDKHEYYKEFVKLQDEKLESALGDWDNIKNILSNKIRIFPMKSFLEYPFIDDDIDYVVVDKGKWKLCRKLLTQNGYKEGKINLREPGKIFLSLRNGEKAPKIHLHKSISWNGVKYLYSEVVWDRRRQIMIRERKIPVPSYEDEILIHALHSVFENKSIKFSEILHLTKITLHNNSDWDYIFNTGNDIGCRVGIEIFLRRLAFYQSKFFQQVTLLPFSNETDAMGDKTDAFVLPYYFTIDKVFLALANKVWYDFSKMNVDSLCRDFYAFLPDIPLYFRLKYRFSKKLKGLGICL